MNLSSWTGVAGIGAIAAAAAAGWNYIRQIVSWVSDVAICRVAITDDAAEAMLAYCWQQGRRSPFGMRCFGGATAWVQPKSRNQIVAFENITSDPALFWFGKAPMIIHRMDGRDATNMGSRDSATSIRMIFVRGTVNIDALVIMAIDHFNHVKQGTNGESKRLRFFCRRLGGRLGECGDSVKTPGAPTPAPGFDSSALIDKIAHKTLRLLQWKAEELIPITPDRAAFHGYAFPPEIMQAMDEMRLWVENEKWFRSKSVPWRRGWLLYGPPGCGKSTLTRAMAMHFDLPIFSIDLSTHDNESFVRAWGEISSSTPALALIEDIDSVFNGRENVSATNKNRDALTFDCLLNSISGVGNSEGVFLVITTNRPETLDAALGVVDNGRSSRPGRIDRVIELGYMQRREREIVAKHILGDFADEYGNAVGRGEGMTPAQFQDHCAQIALRKFFGQPKSRVA